MELRNPNAKKHFFLPEDQALFDYDYVFSASAMWIELGMENVEATFDLTIRHLPKNRNFLVFTGLEEMVEGILNWQFTEDEIEYLLRQKIITRKLAPLLHEFRFSGELWGIPEGSIVFPNEPVVRITGKLWEVNLFTFFLMNALTSNTIFSSKMARSFIAAQNKIYVATCSPVRGHAHEASLKMGRAAYLFGSASGMVPAWARKYGVPFESKARAFHAFIKSFPTELEAMRAAVSVFPNCSVMIDTYGLKQGIETAITVALEQKAKGLPVFSALFIDSGDDAADFAREARFVRDKLDAVGLTEIQITVAGNFEEYKIAELVALEAPIDKVILGTELIVPADDPKLEVVIKMAEFVKDGVLHPTAKLAKGKVSYPGVKQVYRTYDSDGIMTGDTIGLVGEEGLGEPLLKPYIQQGALLKPMPSLDEIKAYLTTQIASLSTELKRIDVDVKYPVAISDKLEALLEDFKRDHSYSEEDISNLVEG